MNSTLMQLELGIEICEKDLLNCTEKEERLIILQIIEDFQNRINECN